MWRHFITFTINFEYFFFLGRCVSRVSHTYIYTGSIFMQAFFVFLSWTFMRHILGYEGFDTLIEGEGKIWDESFSRRSIKRIATCVFANQTNYLVLICFLKVVFFHQWKSSILSASFKKFYKLCKLLFFNIFFSYVTLRKVCFKSKSCVRKFYHSEKRSFYEGKWILLLIFSSMGFWTIAVEILDSEFYSFVKT